LFWLKARLLRIAGAKLGENVRFSSSARIVFNGTLSVGRDTWIGHEVMISGGGDSEIVIGQCCDIAPRVTFVAGTHEIDANGMHAAGKAISESITIGKGVWIGAAATILGNTVIGENCVIAAGAVVRGTFPAKCLIGGVPAKIIKSL